MCVCAQASGPAHSGPSSPPRAIVLKAALRTQGHTRSSRDKVSLLIKEEQGSVEPLSATIILAPGRPGNNRDVCECVCVSVCECVCVCGCPHAFCVSGLGQACVWGMCVRALVCV